MGVLVDVLPLPVGVDDLLDLDVLAKPVLVLALFDLAAGVDKEDVSALTPVSPEDEDDGGDTCPEKAVGRETDDRIEKVFIDEGFSDDPFRTPAEEDAMGHDNTDTPTAFCRRLHHVGDECIVALRRRGRAAVPPVVVLRFLACLISSPLVEREGRIGDDNLEAHELVALDELRLQESVTPLDARAVLVVEEHIHHRESPGGTNGLLSKKGVVRGAVPFTDLSCALEEQ